MKRQQTWQESYFEVTFQKQTRFQAIVPKFKKRKEKKT